MGALRDEHHGWLMPSGGYAAPVYEDPWATEAVAQAPAEATRIISVRPTGFESARVVGEHLRAGSPVVMDVSEMPDADAKRLVDFASGLIFGTRGSIERIARRVFLLAPPEVEVTVISGSLDDSGFYNQS
ncbi:cell division protein SepF [Streptacidiphilus griseoplanus]|uniref:cell division protein SepF n=1 Tax=Peterkaempfera griseoplana TaxID=66896 RepID=UPI0006E12106|nr:cell division protein SepF [Peterkaempfera griseoplana]